MLRDVCLAAHLGPAPRSVRLEVSTRGPWAELRVVRDGDPLDAAVLRALLSTFDGNGEDSGVAIGLYLARALTVAHGGTVGVDQDDRGAEIFGYASRRGSAKPARSVTPGAPRRTEPLLPGGPPLPDTRRMSTLPSGRGPRPLVLALVALGVMVALSLALLVLPGVRSVLPLSSHCRVTVGEDSVALDTDEAQDAATLAAADVRRGRPLTDTVAALTDSFDEEDARLLALALTGRSKEALTYATAATTRRSPTS